MLKYIWNRENIAIAEQKILDVRSTSFQRKMLILFGIFLLDMIREYFV